MFWKRKIENFIKKDNKRVVFLINVRDSLDEVNAFFKRFSQNLGVSSLMIFFNAEVPRQFAQLGLTVKSSEDYLLKEDYEAIDDYVFGGITRTWYFYENVTDYRGIPLGKIVEYDFQKYLTPRIKNLEVIRRAIGKSDFHRIVVIEDTGELEDAAKLFGNIINAHVLVVSFNRRRKPLVSLYAGLRSRISAFLCGLLDAFAFNTVMRLKAVESFVLFDAKLYKYFEFRGRLTNLIRCLLENGLRVRLELWRKKIAYLPLYFLKRRKYFKDWIKYKKMWKALQNSKNFRDIFIYDGIPIWKMVYEELSVYFLRNFPRIISNINILDGFYKKKKVKLVVVRNDVKEFERTLILASRLAKIPSLVIQYGILAETNGHNNLLADEYAAWGKASVEWYGRFGNPIERFKITGNPRFDMFKDWRPQISRRELCRQLNLDENKALILFATQQINKFSAFWTDDLFWVMADKIISVVQRFTDKQLIIKVDPYEDVRPYKNVIKVSSSDNAVVVKDFNIYTLIFLSDLVITLDSTVGIEAMIFDKPLITVNFTKRQDRVPYAKKGAALGVYNVTEIATTIKKALYDEETIKQLSGGREVFKEEYAYKLDGKAGERVTQLLYKYLGDANQLKK